MQQLVVLRGAAEARLALDSVEVSVAERTPREVLKSLAKLDEELERYIVTSEGTIRQAVKVLIDGRPATDLDETISDKSTVSAMVMVLCDG